MYAEIVSAIESAKALRELIKAANSLANYNELVAAVSEVNAKLMEATGVALESQEKQSSLARRVHELEEELLKLKDWEAQAKNYSLTDVGGGIFAYLYKTELQTSQPRHWACAKCFQDKKLSVLQRQHPPAYACHSCGSKITPFRDGKLVSIEGAY